VQTVEQRNKGGGKLSSERPAGSQMRLTTRLPSSRKERHFQPTCNLDHRIRSTRSKANRNVLYFFGSLNIKFGNCVEGRGCGIN